MKKFGTKLIFVLPLFYLACEHGQQTFELNDEFIRDLTIEESCLNELDGFHSMELQSHMSSMRGSLRELSQDQTEYLDITVITIVQSGEVARIARIALAKTPSELFAVRLGDMNSKRLINVLDYDEAFKNISQKAYNGSYMIVLNIRKDMVKCELYESIETSVIRDIKNLSFFN